MTVRVLAVADSDSYLKWAGATLGGLDGYVETSVVVLRTPLAPTAAQTTAAVGPGLDPPEVLGLRGLRARLRESPPDVVLVAATGPTAELTARTVVRTTGADRPALVSGLPGVAWPATRLAVGWRRWSDAFVVHSHAEADSFAAGFTAVGATPRIVLSSLPFVETSAVPAAAVSRVVVAAQSLVPASRADRVRLLDGLARVAAAGLEVVVKLRARAGERQTHNEALPLDVLWAEEHRGLGHSAEALGFADGPMADWLTPGSALVTVSSTAAIESMARGLPTVLLDDFGVDETLLNPVFVGSGCFASLDDLPGVLRAGPPRPDPQWARRNYLHPEPSEWPAAVRELAEQRGAGRLAPLDDIVPLSRPVYARTLLRAALPSPVARRLVRRVR